MNAYSSSGYSSGPNFARSVEDILESIHDEIQHAVDYVDATVIPQARKETSAALRLLAAHLERWAESLHGSVQA